MSSLMALMLAPSGYLAVIRRFLDAFWRLLAVIRRFLDAFWRLLAGIRRLLTASWRASAASERRSRFRRRNQASTIAHSGVTNMKAA